MDMPVSEMSYAQLEQLSNPNSASIARPISDRCRVGVSRYFNIPGTILQVFLATEGAEVGHIRRNSNDSADVGPMQINSINWPALYREYRITPEQLRWDACANLFAGAFLIRTHLDAAGKESIKDIDSLLSILANYHSKTKRHNERYKKILLSHITSLNTSENR